MPQRCGSGVVFRVHGCSSCQKLLHAGLLAMESSFMECRVPGKGVPCVHQQRVHLQEVAQSDKVAGRSSLKQPLHCLIHDALRARKSPAARLRLRLALCAGGGMVGQTSERWAAQGGGGGSGRACGAARLCGAAPTCAAGLSGCPELPGAVFRARGRGRAGLQSPARLGCLRHEGLPRAPRQAKVRRGTVQWDREQADAEVRFTTGWKVGQWSVVLQRT